MSDVKKEQFPAQSPEPSTKNKTKRKISLIDSGDAKTFSTTKKRISNSSMIQPSENENANKTTSKSLQKQGSRNGKSNLTYTTPQVQKSENKKVGIQSTIQEDKNEHSPDSSKEAPPTTVVPTVKPRKPKTIVE